MRKIKDVFLNNKEALDTAVSYWSDFLSKDKDTKFDNGCDDQGNQMASMMAMMANKGTDHSTEKVEVFKRELRRILLADHESLLYTIGVDYNPDCYLQEALSIADIDGSLNVLPWKTNMRFEIMEDKEFTISVSEGYGNPSEVIYPIEKG